MRDIKYLSLLYGFLGGAIIGASMALLFAPESGKDLRARIKELLKKKASTSATTRLSNWSTKSVPR